MNFIPPSVELINEKDNFKRIERCGRICYKSEDKITDDSAFPFFQRIVKRGHTSVLEHSVIYVRTHTPETCAKMKQLLECYVEATGYQHYIRFSSWDDDCRTYFPNDPEFGEGYPMGQCLGSEYLFSGNIRAWRNICERYSGEALLRDTFYSHPAFHDIFEQHDMKLYGKDLGNEDKIYTADSIEIIDSIPLDPDEFPHAYMHYPVSLHITADRGVIDEFARHRAFGHSIESTRYCVAGDMRLTTSNPGNKLTIEELYSNKVRSKNGAWKRMNIRQYNEDTGELEFSHVNDIFYIGEKECIKIKTKLGYELTCTKDHEVLTPNGYVQAGDLLPHKLIMVNGTEKLYTNRDWLYHQNITLNKTFVAISNEFGYNVSTVKKWARKLNLPKKGTGYFNVGHTPWNKGVQDPRQIEALKKYHHSGINDNRRILKEDTKCYRKYNKGFCEVCGSKEELDVHHINHNRNDNNPTNLITLCKPCHMRVHSKNLLTALPDEVVSIENVGVKPVYDISMDSKFHNFVCNGVIVHNCNYSKNGVTFVFPWWYEKIHDDAEFASLAGDFGNRCYDTEEAYQKWINKCKIPQMARGNLTLWVKSEQAITGTVQNWIDFLKLRDSPAAHPEAQRISKMIEKVLVDEVGVKDLWGVNSDAD